MLKDTRNVIDNYRHWEVELIREDLNRRRHNFSILCCNWQNDFNIGSVIRNANAFCASSVYIYGRKKYDRRGAVGTHHYENIEWLKKIDNLDKLLEEKEHNLVAVDNVAGAVEINDFIWPPRCLMAFGQEQIGVESEILERAKDVIYIPQFGSVRSINVACASAICMHDWISKNEK